MHRVNLLSTLVKETDSKIVFLIADGLGGLSRDAGSDTELKSASTPQLDRLAVQSSLGLSIPVARGITPGSGPAHLSLFGYDPVEYLIGRGALAAAGLGFKQKPGDLAARINFCTVDADGIITDRRAGRIPTKINAQLCKKLSSIKIKGVEIIIMPVKEHRAAVVFRADGLGDDLNDSDPQKTGVPPLTVKHLKPRSKKSARIVNEFINKAKDMLKDEPKANMLLTRGFALPPSIPSMNKLYKLKTIALCTYPMYKGLAHFVGMNVIHGLTGKDDQIRVLKEHYRNYTFFFVHYKKTDAAGEDGNFENKVKAIEEFDGLVGEVLGLEPDCLVITGDHSTPAVLKSHSWHEVPVLIHAKYARADGLLFNEHECRKGSLGIFPAKELLALALAHALKLEKFGA